MTEFPELILHIGTTKTGSTAIQVALRKSSDSLAKDAAAFLGISLENVQEARAYPWCQPGDAGRLLAGDFAKREEQVAAVVLAALTRLRQQGVQTAIWSNEAFFGNAKIIPLIKRLRDAGVRVRVIIYIRRHDKWALSAYVQFALKGKDYSGRVKKFADWAAPRSIKAPFLRRWQDAFPGLVELYNFDVIDDVVDHFCRIVGLVGVEGGRANSAPSNALLSAWLVHNDRSNDSVKPLAFRKLGKALDILGPLETGHPKTPPLAELYPSEQDLRSLLTNVSDDLDAVNQVLVEQGEPPLDVSNVSVRQATVDSWELDQILFQAVFSLQRQVFELQDELEKVKANRSTESSSTP
ncbi:hypothetical protein [Mesobacterium pallidum]|uniref:hypothetical protein n=1 Tax=Mesobacterium pallidum TaxID=2872037 RepID=UPI001EE384E5|nr:hypothetical protein [Mesobacterium pallidum]